VATPAPAPQPPAPPKEYRANAALKTIYFNFDKSDIRAADAKTLDASAAWLAANPNMLLLIEGHCDERGTPEYNLALGERRAKATAAYLVSKGVQAERINTVSYGEERPACTEHREACWTKNRRAEFLVKEQ
jgi:peptidoglycan-associated lipoprotein